MGRSTVLVGLGFQGRYRLARFESSPFEPVSTTNTYKTYAFPQALLNDALGLASVDVIGSIVAGSA